MVYVWLQVLALSWAPFLSELMESRALECIKPWSSFAVLPDETASSLGKITSGLDVESKNVRTSYSKEAA